MGAALGPPSRAETLHLPRALLQGHTPLVCLRIDGACGETPVGHRVPGAAAALSASAPAPRAQSSPALSPTARLSGTVRGEAERDCPARDRRYLSRSLRPRDGNTTHNELDRKGPLGSWGWPVWGQAWPRACPGCLWDLVFSRVPGSTHRQGAQLGGRAWWWTRRPEWPPPCDMPALAASAPLRPGVRSASGLLADAAQGGTGNNRACTFDLRPLHCQEKSFLQTALPPPPGPRTDARVPARARPLAVEGGEASGPPV